MKFSEIASRLNGISTPFFGVSWTPATSDVETVRGLIHFMEGRRILYERHHCAESPSSSVARMERSVSEIRAFLTDTLVKGGLSGDLVTSLKTMRSAAMECLDALDRWTDFLATRSDGPFDAAWLTTQDAALEDRRASVALFRLSVNKLMEELSLAYGIEFDPLI